MGTECSSRLLAYLCIALHVAMDQLSIKMKVQCVKYVKVLKIYDFLLCLMWFERKILQPNNKARCVNC